MPKIFSLFSDFGARNWRYLYFGAEGLGGYESEDEVVNKTENQAANATSYNPEAVKQVKEEIAEKEAKANEDEEQSLADILDSLEYTDLKPEEALKKKKEALVEKIKANPTIEIDYSHEAEVIYEQIKAVELEEGEDDKFSIIHKKINADGFDETKDKDQVLTDIADELEEDVLEDLIETLPNPITAGVFLLLHHITDRIDEFDDLQGFSTQVEKAYSLSIKAQYKAIISGTMPTQSVLALLPPVSTIDDKAITKFYAKFPAEEPFRDGKKSFSLNNLSFASDTAISLGDELLTIETFPTAKSRFSQLLLTQEIDKRDISTWTKFPEPEEQWKNLSEQYVLSAITDFVSKFDFTRHHDYPIAEKLCKLFDKSWPQVIAEKIQNIELDGAKIHKDISTAIKKIKAPKLETKNQADDAAKKVENIRLKSVFGETLDDLSQSVSGDMSRVKYFQKIANDYIKFSQSTDTISYLNTIELDSKTETQIKTMAADVAKLVVLSNRFGLTDLMSTLGALDEKFDGESLKLFKLNYKENLLPNIKLVVSAEESAINLTNFNAEISRLAPQMSAKDPDFDQLKTLNILVNKLQARQFVASTSLAKMMDYPEFIKDNTPGDLEVLVEPILQVYCEARAIQAKAAGNSPPTIEKIADELNISDIGTSIEKAFLSAANLTYRESENYYNDKKLDEQFTKLISSSGKRAKSEVKSEFEARGKLVDDLLKLKQDLDGLPADVSDAQITKKEDHLETIKASFGSTGTLPYETTKDEVSAINELLGTNLEVQKFSDFDQGKKSLHGNEKEVGLLDYKLPVDAVNKSIQRVGEFLKVTRVDDLTTFPNQENGKNECVGIYYIKQLDNSFKDLQKNISETSGVLDNLISLKLSSGDFPSDKHQEAFNKELQVSIENITQQLAAQNAKADEVATIIKSGREHAVNLWIALINDGADNRDLALAFEEIAKRDINGNQNLSGDRDIKANKIIYSAKTVTTSASYTSSALAGAQKNAQTAKPFKPSEDLQKKYMELSGGGLNDVYIDARYGDETNPLVIATKMKAAGEVSGAFIAQYEETKDVTGEEPQAIAQKLFDTQKVLLDELDRKLQQNEIELSAYKKDYEAAIREKKTEKFLASNPIPDFTVMSDRAKEYEQKVQEHNDLRTEQLPKESAYLSSGNDFTVNVLITDIRGLKKSQEASALVNADKLERTESALQRSRDMLEKTLQSLQEMDIDKKSEELARIRKEMKDLQGSKKNKDKEKYKILRTQKNEILGDVRLLNSRLASYHEDLADHAAAGGKAEDVPSIPNLDVLETIAQAQKEKKSVTIAQLTFAVAQAKAVIPQEPIAQTKDPVLTDEVKAEVPLVDGSIAANVTESVVLVDESKEEASNGDVPSAGVEVTGEVVLSEDNKGEEGPPPLVEEVVEPDEALPEDIIDIEEVPINQDFVFVPSGSEGGQIGSVSVDTEKDALTITSDGMEQSIAIADINKDNAQLVADAAGTLLDNSSDAETKLLAQSILDQANQVIDEVETARRQSAADLVLLETKTPTLDPPNTKLPDLPAINTQPVAPVADADLTELGENIVITDEAPDVGTDDLSTVTDPNEIGKTAIEIPSNTLPVGEVAKNDAALVTVETEQFSDNKELNFDQNAANKVIASLQANISDPGVNDKMPIMAATNGDGLDDVGTDELNPADINNPLEVKSFVTVDKNTGDISINTESITQEIENGDAAAVAKLVLESIKDSDGNVDAGVLFAEAIAVSSDLGYLEGLVVYSLSNKSEPIDFSAIPIDALSSAMKNNPDKTEKIIEGMSDEQIFDLYEGGTFDEIGVTAARISDKRKNDVIKLLVTAEKPNLPALVGLVASITDEAEKNAAVLTMLESITSVNLSALEADSDILKLLEENLPTLVDGEDDLYQQQREFFAQKTQSTQVTETASKTLTDPELNFALEDFVAALKDLNTRESKDEYKEDKARAKQCLKQLEKLFFPHETEKGDSSKLLPIFEKKFGITSTKKDSTMDQLKSLVKDAKKGRLISSPSKLWENLDTFKAITYPSEYKAAMDDYFEAKGRLDVLLGSRSLLGLSKNLSRKKRREAILQANSLGVQLRGLSNKLAMDLSIDASAQKNLATILETQEAELADLLTNNEYGLEHKMSDRRKAKLKEEEGYIVKDDNLKQLHAGEDYKSADKKSEANSVFAKMQESKYKAMDWTKKFETVLDKNGAIDEGMLKSLVTNKQLTALNTQITDYESQKNLFPGSPADFATMVKYLKTISHKVKLLLDYKDFINNCSTDQASTTTELQKMYKVKIQPYQTKLIQNDLDNSSEYGLTDIQVACEAKVNAEVTKVAERNKALTYKEQFVSGNLTAFGQTKEATYKNFKDAKVFGADYRTEKSSIINSINNLTTLNVQILAGNTVEDNDFGSLTETVRATLAAEIATKIAQQQKLLDDIPTLYNDLPYLREKQLRYNKLYSLVRRKPRLLNNSHYKDFASDIGVSQLVTKSNYKNVQSAILAYSGVQSFINAKKARIVEEKKKLLSLVTSAAAAITKQ